MAQAARLNLRMQKELKLLLTDPPPGASFPHLSPSSISLTAIDAQIEGPEGTVYEKGVFKIKIQIPERYPFQPPIVTFGTPIYHPNIDTGGRICLDILNLPPKGAWQPSLNISTVLTSIGLLLSEPNPDDGLMCEASREFKYNKQVFDQKARSMTEKYARPNASPNHGGLRFVADSIVTEDKPPEPVKTDLYEHAASCKKVSGAGRKLSLDASCSGSNKREGDMGINEITSDTLCEPQIQEPKQDSKDVSFGGKDHVLTVVNCDHDQYNKPPAISSKKLCLSSKNLQHETLDSTTLHDLDAQRENLLKVQKKSIDGSGLTNPKCKRLSGSNTREIDMGMNEVASNTLCQSQIQEPKQDSKDVSFDGKCHVLTAVNSDHVQYNKSPAISSKKLCLSIKNLHYETLNSTTLLDLDAQKEKLLMAQKKSLDGSGLTNPKRKRLSGSNTRESDMGMNETASNTFSQSQIQEPKQDLKDMSCDCKDHVLTVINSDQDQYDQQPAISSKKLRLSSKNLQHKTLYSTTLHDLDAQKENLLKVQKTSIDGSGLTNSKCKRLSGSNTRKSDMGMSETASNTLSQSQIQEPKQDSKDMSFNGKDHVLTVIKSDHDQYNKPPAIISKKLFLSSKNLQHETLDSTTLHDLDAQKENMLKVQKKSIEGSGLTNPKHRRLSGSNTTNSGMGMNEIASNSLRQPQIQEPKEDSKDVSFDGKDPVLTVINSDHDQYNKPPAISSKKLCLSIKNLQLEILDSTMLHDLDGQKENLLQVQKKSIDENGLTNPKRKRLGLTGKKPSLEFLGNSNNRKFCDSVKAGGKGAISTPVLKLPRKPLQVLEGKHNCNMCLRASAEILDKSVMKNDGERFDEETLEQEGLCDPEGVIVLDSEDSEEEEKKTASNSRRLIARKRVLSKC